MSNKLPDKAKNEKKQAVRMSIYNHNFGMDEKKIIILFLFGYRLWIA